MQHCYRSLYGNPSSLHFAGRQAGQALQEARMVFASGLGAKPHEIVFTGGGSEADNLALLGAAQARQSSGKHIITSSIEHHAVLETCQYLATLGFETTYLPVDETGMVRAEDLRAAIRDDTTLVSIMHANNEVGTIQPIAELARIAHAGGALFHTDAVQTGGHLPLDVDQLDVDLMTLSAHKFYGPKGVGVLYVREDVELVPLIHGGSQEDGRRGGTENVPGIMGATKAFEIALQHLGEEVAMLQTLRDQLWEGIEEADIDVRLNGHPTQRLPGHLSVSFKGVEAEGALLRLSREGIAASMGSACNSESIEPSHVIEAIGLDQQWARGTLRFTLGRFTTQEDVAYTTENLIPIIREMQSHLVHTG
jgi:cysteine desulfurase